MENGKLQKGSFIKYANKVYMIIGDLESEYKNEYAFAGIKVMTRNGRFKFNTKTLKSFNSVGYRYTVIEHFNIDKRDKIILNEFIDYINNFDLKIYSRYVSYRYQKEEFFYFLDLKLLNGNFKKFKDHSRFHI